MENYDISQATGMMDQEAISLKKDEGDSVHLPITSDEVTMRRFQETRDKIPITMDNILRRRH